MKTFKEYTMNSQHEWRRPTYNEFNLAKKFAKKIGHELGSIGVNDTTGDISIQVIGTLNGKFHDFVLDKKGNLIKKLS